MKKTFLPLILLPLALTACNGLWQPAKPTVAGLVHGQAPKAGPIKIASVGASFQGIQAANADHINVPLKEGTTGYAANLPALEKSGTVSIFAYVDVNNNGTYDPLFEPKTSSRMLVFVAKSDPLLFSQLKHGWNLIDKSGVRVQQSGTHLGGADLSW